MHLRHRKPPASVHVDPVKSLSAPDTAIVRARVYSAARLHRIEGPVDRTA